MSNLNSINLIGRLTRDPETKIVGAHNVCQFSIAFDIGFGDKKKPAFVEVTAWNKSGDFVQANFKKGKEILIQGSLGYDSWDDKETGKKRSKLFVTAERVGFVGSKSSGSSEAVSEGSSPVDDSSEIPF